jgi:transposase
MVRHDRQAGREDDDTEMQQYTDTFKARMVRRMLGPNAVSANTLEAEVGVPQPTLSRWLRETASFQAMKKKSQPPSSAKATPAGRRPQDWTAEEKLRAVAETLDLEGEALGEYLRRNGIHVEQVEQWKGSAKAAMERPTAKARSKGESRRIKELERELRMKEKALAETAALLVLRKKVNALWGDADDDTDERNGS